MNACRGWSNWSGGRDGRGGVLVCVCVLGGQRRRRNFKRRLEALSYQCPPPPQPSLPACSQKWINPAKRIALARIPSQVNDGGVD